jgi:hypothetical protein
MNLLIISTNSSYVAMYNLLIIFFIFSYSYSTWVFLLCFWQSLLSFLLLFNLFWHLSYFFSFLEGLFNWQCRNDITKTIKWEIWLCNSGNWTFNTLMARIYHIFSYICFDTVVLPPMTLAYCQFFSFQCECNAFFSWLFCIPFSV